MTTRNVPKTVVLNGGLYELKTHPDDPIHLQVMLPYQLHHQLKMLATEQGTTMKALVTERVKDLVSAK